jgi:hypothetical protein
MTTKYTIAEREAIEVVRKTMLTKPNIIKAIMRDMAYMQSFGILTQAQTDLKQLLEVTQTFSDAAMAIMKQQEEYFDVDNGTHK